jgi:tRNA-dihydrouridine synthase
MYRSAVHYEFIQRAVEAMPCPVLANGNIYSAAKAESVLAETGARGLMIGRGAIRNPWLFTQIRQRHRGEPEFVPTGRQVLGYLRDLFESIRHPDYQEKAHVTHMKKYLNFVGVGIDADGRFLREMRRATTEVDYFRVCAEFLDHDQPTPLEPFPISLGERDVMAGEHR